MVLALFKTDGGIYNLRIVPPEPVFGEISEIKRRFEAVFGKQPLSVSKPHITLASFKMDRQDEGILLNTFSRLETVGKFQLEIQGFDNFGEGSTVFLLKVIKSRELEKIQRDLKVLWTTNLRRKPTTLTLPDRPHITISKTHGKEMMDKSLAFFRKMDYKRRFEVAQLTLVSRYAGGRWDSEHQIKLV
tara:strand:+ start:16681 stop:17244 length:564 start_codon:yes stop_codon:yes gene_type:complete